MREAVLSTPHTAPVLGLGPRELDSTTKLKSTRRHLRDTVAALYEYHTKTRCVVMHRSLPLVVDQLEGAKIARTTEWQSPKIGKASVEL